MQSPILSFISRKTPGADPVNAPDGSNHVQSGMMDRMKEYGLALLGGFLAFFYLGNAPIPFAFWVAPVLLLHFARSQTPARGFVVLTSVIYLATGAADTGILPLGGVMYFAWVLVVSLIQAIPFLLDRLLCRRIEGLRATLVFPLTCVAVEFGISRLSPSATWGLTGYTQFDCPALTQLVSATGVFGITFLVTCFAAVINRAWDCRFDWPEIRTVVISYAAVLFGVLVAGSFRLATSEHPERTVRAAAISYPREMFLPGEATRIRFGQIPPESRDLYREKSGQLQDWFLEATHREATSGAKLVIWPELNVMVFKEDEQEFIERASRLARADTTYLLMGMATVSLGDARPLENKAVFMDDKGNILGAYVKGHPMMGPEQEWGKPGADRPFVVITGLGRTAVAICFDMDFPSFIRQAGSEQPDLLLVPANDWAEIKRIHFWMAAFRAVENGVTMIRATSTGLSAVVDPYGRTLALTDHFIPGARIMVAQVPIVSTRTIYAQVGDLFAWLCVAGLLAILRRALLRPPSLTEKVEKK
jgi:apolipoprotein N-acyltransferase